MVYVECVRCGGELEERENVYVCKYCKCKMEKHTLDDVSQKLSALLEENKQEQLANARRNLYDAVHDS